MVCCSNRINWSYIKLDTFFQLLSDIKFMRNKTYRYIFSSVSHRPKVMESVYKYSEQDIFLLQHILKGMCFPICI